MLQRLDAAVGALDEVAARRTVAAAGQAEGAVHAAVANGSAPEEGDDPRPGLLALSERLEEREAEAFARLRAEWLGGAADAFSKTFA